MNLEKLNESLKTAAGLRLRLKLQPLYGIGEIVFPPTVADEKGPKYLDSERRIPGYEEKMPCTTIDSVQSQANRMEKALLADIREGNIKLPHIETDFSGISGLVKPVGKITCFEAPHRVFDAIIRDSVDEDEDRKHFPLTKAGAAAIRATARDAKAIFQISPASLLFGCWDSTGISGGLGEKYTRCVVSELVAVNSITARRAGVRADPLSVAKEQPLEKILAETKDEVWQNLKEKRKKLKKPSDINHGNVPWGDTLDGVTCDYIQQSTTISFPALRQLHFPVEGIQGGDSSAKAQAVLAAIALHAATLNAERGWHLRSRCDLVPEDGQKLEWEVMGASLEKIAVATSVTRNLLKEAISKAKEAGLPWNEKPVQLTPSEALERLVVGSQQAHHTTTTET